MPVLNRIHPGEVVPIEWTSAVRPSFPKAGTLPDGARRQAVSRAVAWYRRSRMLVDARWEHRVGKAAAFPDRTGPAPERSLPPGNGSRGVLEGMHSTIKWDGSQWTRWWLRADCASETAMAFAVASWLSGQVEDRETAENLQDWLYGRSALQPDHRRSVNDPEWGLIGWNTVYDRVYYGDDNARVLLGTLATAAALDSDRWNEALVRGMLGNYRTTGTLGFRTGRLEGPELQARGWEWFAAREVENLAPHYESWLWAVYLRMYDLTGYLPLLERARSGIRRTMMGYPDEWRWTNGLQQERARMLLPLAWLVRVDDAPLNRAWLRRVAGDLLAHQGPDGAIHEELGVEGMGRYGPPRSNADYGTREAPLIQESGDPIADMLYTSNFAFFGLSEAAAATGDPALRQAAESLAAFLIRIQVTAPDDHTLDGAWFRAFDTEQWIYWASNSDLGWGAWAIETGWTQSWISTVLALHELGISFWDLTADVSIEGTFHALRKQAGL